MEKIPETLSPASGNSMSEHQVGSPGHVVCLQGKEVSVWSRWSSRGTEYLTYVDKVRSTFTPLGASSPTFVPLGLLHLTLPVPAPISTDRLDSVALIDTTKHHTDHLDKQDERPTRRDIETV